MSLSSRKHSKILFCQLHSAGFIQHKRFNDFIHSQLGVNNVYNLWTSGTTCNQYGNVFKYVFIKTLQRKCIIKSQNNYEQEISINVLKYNLKQSFFSFCPKRILASTLSAKTTFEVKTIALTLSF